MHQSDQHHWDTVFSTKATNEVSWFQPYPNTSMEFIHLFNVPLDASIIDIGGGDSLFVDALLEKDYTNLTVLDISEKAIDRTRQRLGSKASCVEWILSDIRDFVPEEKYDFWHDRAAFHFLTREKDIKKYTSIAENALGKSGYLVVGTFSEMGPSKCSGLHVTQYTEARMSATFDQSFGKIKCIPETHNTPTGSIQDFLFCGFKKVSFWSKSN